MFIRGNPHTRARTSNPAADQADALKRMSNRIAMLEAKLAGRVMPRHVTIGFDGDNITIEDARTGRTGKARIEWND